MKKHPIDEVNVTFSGPVTMMRQAIDAMRELGFQELSFDKQLNDEMGDDSSISWRESRHFVDMPLPGGYISGARYREGLTQVQLSERTGIPRRHISEMENGKRPIGKSNARKLAEALDLDPRLLLSI